MRLRAQVPGLRAGVRVEAAALVDEALGRRRGLDDLEARLVAALALAPVWPAQLVQTLEAPRLAVHARVTALAEGGWLDTPRATERLAAGAEVIPVGPDHVWAREAWEATRQRMVGAARGAESTAALIAALVGPVTETWADLAARHGPAERFLARDAWHLPEVDAQPGGHLMNFLTRARVVATALSEANDPVDPTLTSLAQVLSGHRLGAPPALAPDLAQRVVDGLVEGYRVTGTVLGDVAWWVGALLAGADASRACVDTGGHLTKMLRGQAVGVPRGSDTSADPATPRADGLREELIDLLAFNGLVFARGDVPIALWRQAQGGLPRTDHR